METKRAPACRPVCQSGRDGKTADDQWGSRAPLSFNSISPPRLCSAVRLPFVLGREREISHRKWRTTRTQPAGGPPALLRARRAKREHPLGGQDGAGQRPMLAMQNRRAPSRRCEEELGEARRRPHCLLKRPARRASESLKSLLARDTERHCPVWQLAFSLRGIQITSTALVSERDDSPSRLASSVVRMFLLRSAASRRPLGQLGSWNNQNICRPASAGRGDRGRRGGKTIVQVARRASFAQH